MNEYKSKYGFHPCDYETFKKLKELHKEFHKTLRDFHRWYRWTRKEPQNRKGIEPVYNPMFVLDKTWLRVTQGTKGRNCKWFPKTVTDHGIVAFYQQARKPRPNPVEPFDAETVAKINKLYEELMATKQAA